MASDKREEQIKNVIDCLNKARKMEMQAIHQYMIQYYLLAEWDYGQLCAWQKLISVDEMRHAQKFAKRIEALGGNPACEMAGPIEQPQTIKQIYPYDFKLETNTVEVYSELSEICAQNGDHESAGLFGSIIAEERVHLQFYKDTENHINILGDNYLAKYAQTSKHSGPIKSFVKVWEKEDF